MVTTSFASRRAPGLVHAKLHQTQLLGGVSVAAEYHSDATFPGRHLGNTIQIEPTGLAIQLHQAAVIGGGFQNRFQVQIISFPLADEPASGWPIA